MDTQRVTAVGTQAVSQPGSCSAQKQDRHLPLKRSVYSALDSTANTAVKLVPQETVASDRSRTSAPGCKFPLSSSYVDFSFSGGFFC